MRYTRSIVIGIALAATAALAACSDGQAATFAPQTSDAPSAEAPSAPGSSDETSAAPTGKAPAPAKAKPTKAKPATTKPKASSSDLSALRSAGIKPGKSILIDVADDGVDLFLAVGENGRVGFTGTTRTDSTMMSLQPAAVSAANRVVIKPPFFNEEVGAGYCVANTAGAAMKLETCKAGKASQIWRVALAGDSGQFELHGAHGVIRVEGRTGLQVLPFAS